MLTKTSLKLNNLIYPDTSRITISELQLQYQNYNIRNFEAQIDTDSGFLLKKDPNIIVSFNQLLSTLEVEATLFTDGSKSSSEDRVGFAIYSLS